MVKIAFTGPVAVIQHLFYGTGDIGAYEMTAVPADSLMPFEIELLKRLSGSCPGEDGSCSKDHAAVEEIEARGQKVDWDSLRAPECTIVAFCQFYYD